MPRIFKILILLIIAFNFSVEKINAQTPVPICGQLNSFTGMTRGYWFVSPVNFTICGIYVPTNMSMAAQSVAIVRFNNNTPPPAWPGTTNAFVQLFLQQNYVPNNMIPCNVVVAQGDVIGVYGSRGNAVNSYGNPNCATTINGQPTTLVRSGFQFNLAGLPPANIWTEAWYNIGRVIIYYNCCPPPPAIPNMNGPTTVCEGGTYTYSVPTMPLAQSYNWTVPTGATVQSGQGTNTVTVQFGNTSGNICVNYTDTCTNSPDLCVPIQVDLKPSPSNAGPDQFICGAVGQLAGNIPGIGTGLWNVLFGGSTVSNPTQNNSMVNNLSVGPNTFEWEITNTPACPSSRDTVVLTRYAQPQADFVATTVCFGTPTVFVNTTNNNGANIASYEWDLNSDGIMDYFVPNFSHTFALPGIYNSCLIVTTTDGCKDTICKPVVVNPMPIADYTANNVCDGATMSFFNTSNILSGTIDVYDWQFGDGSSSNLVNPTHLYAGPGLYTVTLTVTSDSGCTSSITKTIQIYSNPTANFSAPNQCLYDAVNFFDQSVVGNATITGWNWNFGDNTTSNIQHPSHLYSFYNNYQVQLIVTSSQGCNDTIIKTVVVHPVPTANFTANNVCLGDPTNFVNLSTIPQGSFSEQWFFGDGSNTNTFNATHNYLQPGNFIPYLVITSDSGCKDTAFLNIEVWAIPEPQFSLNNTCENDTVIFTDLSQIVLGNIVGWTWDFGNGLPVSNQQNPYNFYYAPGGYTVILTTTSDKGCVKTLTKQIDIFPSPKVEFAYSDELVGCSPLCIDFFDQSTINPMYNSTLQHYL
ncbi:MAG: hypothetical protein BroJett020_14200 [Bacteroidota bacterium]|nr:MAG: hypothetical protein BroJett020_14200 [Bacteroidota bacterium]